MVKEIRRALHDPDAGDVVVRYDAPRLSEIRANRPDQDGWTADRFHALARVR
jgi:hypothetical protein